MKTFVTSDHHFGHTNILTFKNNLGNPLRPFSCYQEMEDHMITKWNSVVKPEDKVYHLGDFAMKKQFIKVADKLNGRKTLIAGNHDIFNTKEYLPHFENVRGYRVLNCKDNGRVILSHIPLHPNCFGRFKLNIHGHLHANNIDDPRYINVSVEQTDFVPVDVQQYLDA